MQVRALPTCTGPGASTGAIRLPVQGGADQWEGEEDDADRDTGESKGGVEHVLFRSRNGVERERMGNGVFVV